ncbi:MAG: lamin tail domain-containing protein [Pontiellaceae bacterium]|nr:lamin tail domain-containing protein [Pontiellaceae bacterium]
MHKAIPYQMTINEPQQSPSLHGGPHSGSVYYGRSFLTALTLWVGASAFGQPVFEPPGPSTRRSPITISEIMVKPAARLDGRNAEFIELYNSNPWPENVGGFRLAGQVDYTLPEGTKIPSQGYLVIAASPADMQEIYGLSTVYGPYTNALRTSGKIRVYDEQDSKLLQVEYDDMHPWPAGADGTGHSIVLARASYGEADPRAWERSELIGGTPGTGEVLITNGLRNVVINEVLAHTDPPLFDSIELYNHSNNPVDLGGCSLSDDPATNKFTLPLGTIIPARGFVTYTELDLGFALDASGETIYFKNPESTQVLDALHFAVQQNGVSYGRYPNGANEWYPLSNLSLGSDNDTPLISGVGFNEIMYHPLAGGDDRQYIELYNQGNRSMDLSGWKLGGGIKYTFPQGTTIAAGDYVVVGRNAAELIAVYPQLNSANTYGDFNDSLSGDGERITLMMPDEIASTNRLGLVVTNFVNIVVDEVTYGTGGRWGRWSDGGGSSLELLDPRSNKRLASSWGDSYEMDKAPWTTIEATGVLDNGSGSFAPLQLGLLDAGECLIDDIEAINSSGIDGVINGNFESGADGLSFVGSHSRSSLESKSGILGSTALHLRTADSIAMGPNAVTVGLENIFGSGQTATLRFKARWLHGTQEPLLRFWGNYLEAVGQMTVPDNLGSPGLPNSRAISNNAPAIYQVRHDPAVPAANEPIVITARIEDPDGLGFLAVRYRVDPTNTTSIVTMNDSGTGGDEVAGDGIFSATLPGQSNGALAFAIVATDIRGAGSQFPEFLDDNTPDRECVVWFGDPEPSNEFGTYHMWMTQANVDRWKTLPVMSNENIDGTLVYNNRIIYNMGGRYSGSPWHQNYDGPDGNRACHYVWTLPKDDRMLGYSSFNKIQWPGNDIQSGTITSQQDDPTLQREQAANMFLRELGVPWMNRRLVAVYVNGTRRGQLMEDALRPTGSGARDQYMHDDSGGQLFKIQRWYDGESTTTIALADLQKYTTTGGAYKAARYRPVWALKSSPISLSNFENLYALIEAANAYSDPDYEECIENIVDMENWMRVAAAHHAAGNWDIFGISSGQNASAWVGPQTRWTLLTIDFGICLDQNLSGVDLFRFDDNAWSQMYSKPKFQRMHYRALNELVNGIMRADVINPIMDAKYNAMIAAGYTPASPANTQSRIESRRNSIIAALSSVNAATFRMDTDIYSTANNSVTLTGSAPVDVVELSIDGVRYEPTWTGLTTWSLTLPINNGMYNWNVAAYDRNNQPVGDTFLVSVENTGMPEEPQGNIVINEIMANAVSSDAEYIELFNRSSTTAFDLSGWIMNGLSYTFPTGSIIEPNEYLVLAKKSIVFSATYDATIPVFDTFDGNLQSNGETLTLIRPGATPEENVIIDQVRYETGEPWPVSPPTEKGMSLQLIDAAQDNSRSANWTVAASVGDEPPPPINDLLPLTKAWKYEQTTELDGINWTDPDYDDSAWSSGYGALGYESSNNATVYALINTTLSPPANRSGQAVYFRTELNITTDLTGYEIMATGYIDDGAVIYINGVEVPPRLRMPDGALISTTKATSYPNSGDTGPPDTFTLPTSAFHSDMNTLAVEVHQVNENSSDIVFGLKLDAVYPETDYTVTPGAANSVEGMLPEFPALWLNEVQPVNLDGQTDNAGDYDPWLELYNAGPESISLDGFYLTDDYNNLTQWAFPANLSIPSGAFLVVWCDGEPNESTPTIQHTDFSLSPTSGQVGLSRIVKGSAQIVDYLNYTNLPANYSYGALPDGQPFYRSNMFYASAGTTNTAAVPPITVSINEWMAANAGTLYDPADGDYEDWFELYNPGTNRVDLGGYYLTDDLLDPFKYRVPNNGHYTIDPGSFLLVWADGEPGQNETNRPDLHVDFSLNREGDLIAIFGADGVMMDSTTFTTQSVNVSEGRIPDGSTYILPMKVPTPRAPNHADNTPPILTPPADATLTLGQSLAFFAEAVDANIPAQTLTFSLSNAPPGAVIHPNTGLFSWTPHTAPSTNSMAIVVRDNGTPNLSDTEWFSVKVVEPPIMSNISVSASDIQFSWPTVEGQHYRVYYKNALTDPDWSPLGNIIPGTGATVIQSDTATDADERFYTIKLEP